MVRNFSPPRGYLLGRARFRGPPRARRIGDPRASGDDHAVSVRSLLPRHPLDLALWVVLSMSAGFAEELVFRGYLLTQFRAMTRSTGLALILQAVLFGVSHGYQGVRACVTISLYGLLFGPRTRPRSSCCS